MPGGSLDAAGTCHRANSTGGTCDPRSAGDDHHRQGRPEHHDHRVSLDEQVRGQAGRAGNGDGGDAVRNGRLAAVLLGQRDVGHHEVEPVEAALLPCCVGDGHVVATVWIHVYGS